MRRDTGKRKAALITGALVVASVAATGLIGAVAYAADQTTTATADETSTTSSSTSTTTDSPSISSGSSDSSSSQATSGGS